MSHKLLNLAETASRLGISKSTVLRHVEAGKLPKPVRLGVRLLWPSNEIEEVVARLVEERDAA